MSARVVVRSRSLRRLRFDGSLSRWLFTAAALVGIASCVRYAIFPPRPHLPTPPPVQHIDQGAEAYAVAFARAYLTLDAHDPEQHARALAPFVDANGDPDGGYSPPEDLSQRVSWATVVQSRPSELGGETYTVAAQTTASGLVYLTVTVRRDGAGALQLVGLPALVGPPQSRPAQDASGDTLTAVVDADVTEVTMRALRNYLAGDSTDLRADLAANAVVSLPVTPLRLQRVERVVWDPSGRSVLATVDATDPRGGLFQLTYEIDVDRSGARPYVSAIQTNPRT
jgi:Conjugative transposon protein TcpC